jgi:ubiquinone biosynthesis protein UbiJ
MSDTTRDEHSSNGSGATSTVSDALRRTLADAEGRMASSMEQVVGSKGFSQLLSQAAENTAALASINAELWDMVLRNFRMAGRADIHRLGRRVNGLDDKLEMILQELESLRHGWASTEDVP